jgi:FixJ family two-component response regulator
MSMPLAVVDIVDDNVEVLRSLGRVLSAHGYPVCMFTSAEQYLRTVEEGKASCVVIALGLRGSISGLELGRAILASRRAIPVVFIAGSADASMKAQALLMGCIAYLEEPVSSELLISAIRSSGASSSWHPPPGPGR